MDRALVNLPLPDPLALLMLLGHFAAGVLVGMLYFRSLWWMTRRFAAGEAARVTLTWMIARLAGIGGLLALAALEGALPLLLVALGVFAGRAVVMRRYGRGAP